MLPIAYYLLKLTICSGILVGYYWLFLRNKVFHHYNRFYLLAVIVLSLVLPFIQINIWNGAQQPKSEVIHLLQVVTSNDDYVQQFSVAPQSRQQWDATTLMALGYLLVSAIFFMVFLHVLWTIRTLLKKYKRRLINNIYFVNTDAKGTPFSFLRYIFWNDKIDIESTTGGQIFRHEVAHVQEKHSYDKLFMNIVMILFWINPFFWLIRKELNMIHEFIADKKAVEDSDTASFAAMILQSAYPQHRFQLTNNFFYSPIKRRLLMLTKNNSPKVNYISLVLVLPLAVLVFAAFTFKAKTTIAAHSGTYSGKKITIVIDPACGGNSYGWHSATGVNEKDINLAIAQKISALNSNENIRIILTRNTDVDALGECSNIVAKNNADLFITISLGQNIHDSKERGWDICIPYDTNRYYSQSRAFGSILFNSFSADYGLPPYQNQLLKRSRVMTVVNCPALMVQPGFITNMADINYFNDPVHQEKIARNILAALEVYAISGNRVNSLPYNTADTVPGKKDPLPPLGKHPIYILNGNEVDSAVLGVLSPNGIMNINILKGKDATDKYGFRGKNGVVEIKTKNKDITGVNNSLATDAGSDNDISIHATSIDIKNAPANMLYILNGMETDKLAVDNIKPADIEDVRILKNNLAIKVYGDKGKNGVIIINTKPGYGVANNWKADKVIAHSSKSAGVGDVYIGANPVIIIDGKEYTGKTMEEVVKITGQNQFESVDMYSVDDAVKLYGDKAKGGAIIAVTKKTVDGKLPAGTDAKAIINPRIFVGDLTATIVDIERFKKQTEIRVTPGYSFVETDVYFSGVGFTSVEVVHLKGTSLKPIESYIKRCMGGTMISFDNNYIRDASGKLIALDGYETFSLYDADNKKSLGDKIFTAVEDEPRFPGAEDGWKKYLAKHLDRRIPVLEGWLPGTYTVMLQFMVQEDGSVTNVSTTNYTGTKTAQHCIDLIKNGPKWEPAKQYGQPVKAYNWQPVSFHITDQFLY